MRREEFFLTIENLCRKTVAGTKSSAEGGYSCATSSPARQLSVLVAEDNVVNQRVLTALLSRLGHRFEVVGDGEAAIKAVRRSAYDVVLMDCQMPHVDGFGATAGIRQLPGATGQVPIVAVTANAMSGDRERCLAAGMNAYVAKPVSLVELAVTLERVHSEVTRTS
jgi:CheY-like chemotaxis protein